jgi:hypothetical protein
MKYCLRDENCQVNFTSLWKQGMMDTLKALTNDATWQMKVRFHIYCALCCPRPDIKLVGLPVSTFAVCNGPDKDTFKLGGLDVKFLGVGKDLISGDSNTHVILAGKKILAGRSLQDHEGTR